MLRTGAATLIKKTEMVCRRSLEIKNIAAGQMSFEVAPLQWLRCCFARLMTKSASRACMGGGRRSISGLSSKAVLMKFGPGRKPAPWQSILFLSFSRGRYRNDTAIAHQKKQKISWAQRRGISIVVDCPGAPRATSQGGSDQDGSPRLQ